MDSNKRLSGKSVLMVLDAYYPPDLRLAKEIPVLMDAGVEVTLVCYRRKGEPLTENLEGLKIHRTETAVSNRIKGLVDIYNALTFKNILISRSLSKEQVPDIVHVHDLPVAGTVFKWAQKNSVRTILDLHENYPEALKIWFSWRKNPLIRLKNRLFFGYSRWKKREVKMINRYDTIVAVIDEMKTRMLQESTKTQKDIHVVSNTESKIPPILPERKIANAQSQIVYVGGIGPHRGLDTAIQAMPFLRDKGNFKLVIVGSGNPDTISRLKEMSVKNGVEDVVDFIGRVPLKEALGYMRGAFLNIIPHHKNDHTDNTIPHKLFQIMNSGFPLMVSSCAPLKRVVESEKTGLVFEAGNPKSFAEKVVFATDNADILDTFTKNGIVAIREGRWNWEYDSKVLIKAYSELKK